MEGETWERETHQLLCMATSRRHRRPLPSYSTCPSRRCGIQFPPPPHCWSVRLPRHYDKAACSNQTAACSCPSPLRRGPYAHIAAVIAPTPHPPLQGRLSYMTQQDTSDSQAPAPSLPTAVLSPSCLDTTTDDDECDGPPRRQ
ncbi:hypothetical protein BJ912DRAFT_1055119 [Pholiota molesta]|nr:hypothetical protein BJ912DRAFT_1055119 [Pholiota molesta]